MTTGDAESLRHILVHKLRKQRNLKCCCEKIEWYMTSKQKNIVSTFKLGCIITSQPINNKIYPVNSCALHMQKQSAKTGTQVSTRCYRCYTGDFHSIYFTRCNKLNELKTLSKILTRPVKELFNTLNCITGFRKAYNCKTIYINVTVNNII